MTDALDFLSKPFRTFSGKAAILFDDGTDRYANFTINQFLNGRIRGDLEFSSDDLFLLNYITQMKRFSIKEIDAQNDQEIDCKDCFLTSYHGKNCKFSTHQLAWNHAAVTKRTRKELFLKFL